MATEQRKDETLEEYRERLWKDYERKYPSLAALALPGPFDEKDDIWLEHMTGEPQGKRRGPRETDL